MQAAKQVGARNAEDIVSEKRFFMRLTILASWRSEYILRTRLLRCIARGRPGQVLTSGSAAPRWSSSNAVNAQITYNSHLLSTVTHLDATFGTGLNKRLPKFIHASEEAGLATSSDPSAGKIDTWGFLDPQTFFQFSELHPAEPEYGLGAGDIVGMPNSIAVSRKYGLAHAEGSPNGRIYYRSMEPTRGRMLMQSLPYSAPELGVPWLDASQEAMCSIWLAKSSNIPDLTEGLIGILSGSSLGVVTAYSLGTSGLRGQRIDRGEVTAKWVLSPGVPIVAIAVDEKRSTHRQVEGRVWAVALNALGEVYYLKDFPKRPEDSEDAKLSDEKLYELAWVTGRSVYWSLAEPTRRTAFIDPYERSSFDGSYSPRGSCVSMGLSKDQTFAETKEIEQFACKKPKHFRQVCEGWDMRRRLDVDFAGINENRAGESIVIFECGLDEGQIARVKRYTRLLQQSSVSGYQSEVQTPISKPVTPSLFGGPSPARTTTIFQQWSFSKQGASRKDSFTSAVSDEIEEFEVWRTSTFSFGSLKSNQITTTAIDLSTFALLTVSEDPLLSLSAPSQASSPFASPLDKMPRAGEAMEIPGQRSRLMAAGTKMGTIIIWNMRAPVSPSSELVNTIEPLRVIHTDSPQISCLALSALYLVHGGNDGLVQAWDLLSSSAQPIRTINSRFSSRARRRLFQAEASPWGVGVNLFAAGAVYLDPDPTMLRGMVSLGTHLRYWSYSSQAADQYKSSKRRLRRSERGSNQGPDKVTQTGRGALQDYITQERRELEQEKKHRRKEQARMAGRFGVDLLGPGATDDQIMAYATLLSEESLQEDEARRQCSSASSETVTDVAGSPLAQMEPVDDDEEDPELAAALRASLEETMGSSPLSTTSSSLFQGGQDYSIRYVRDRRSPSRSPPVAAGGSSSHQQQAEAYDVDFALQLSIAEERSRADAAEREFPLLEEEGASRSESGSRGKGKEREI